MVNDDRTPSAFDSATFDQNGTFHVDMSVGSATISPCGRDVALASREGLYIIDLDSPNEVPRHLVHRTCWDVADVQWSPFASRDHWVVSTSNQKALVWNLASRDRHSSIEHELRGHRRAITDINFSLHYPDILATCAVDSFVHCWDLRRPFKPALSFSDWHAGATQVKWSRQNEHLLASSHDKFLKIWDTRKGAHPLHAIPAHSTKIYGVDWNSLDPGKIATCSLDCTIKIWDLDDTSPDPLQTIQTPFPVWRARFTPFGHGILALPQRGDYRLHLYKTGETSTGAVEEPVHAFQAHSNNVKEFLWRPRGTLTNDVDDREFQLISWGSDENLCMHKITKDILALVGYTRPMQVRRDYPFTRQGAAYQSYRTPASIPPKEALISVPIIESPSMTLPMTDVEV